MRPRRVPNSCSTPPQAPLLLLAAVTWPGEMTGSTFSAALNHTRAHTRTPSLSAFTQRDPSGACSQILGYKKREHQTERLEDDKRSVLTLALPCSPAPGIHFGMNFFKHASAHRAPGLSAVIHSVLAELVCIRSNIFTFLFSTELHVATNFWQMNLNCF